MKRALALAAVALVGLGGVVVGEPTPATAALAAPYTVDAKPRFNLPTAAKGVTVDKYSDSRTELTDHLVDLIKHTAAGQTIRISLYGWDDWADQGLSSNPTPALVAALNRGVTVKVLLDAAAKLSNDYTTLSRAMAGKSGSFIKRCGVGKKVENTVKSGRACLGTAVNHAKFFLFSKVGDSPYVVVQGTGHITQTWNNVAWDAMATVVGKKALYDGYVKYFNDQNANVKQPNYYRTVGDGSYKAYFFPRAGNADYRTSDDTIYGVLGNVTCTGNKTVGTSSAHRTIIRVLTWKFTRVELAQKLRKLADSNCWIDVATNMNEMTSGVRSALKGHPRINVDDGNTGNLYVHGKYLLIEGNYAGKADSKNLWVGSSNLTYPALKANDETLLKVTSAAWHDAFRQNFRNIMALSPDAKLS